jgi:hypothetical protein
VQATGGIERGVRQTILVEVIAQLTTGWGMKSKPPGGLHFRFEAKLMQQFGVNSLQNIENVHRYTVTTDLIAWKFGFVNKHMIHPFLCEKMRQR